MTKNKVAIICDWLEAYGGAEQIVEAITLELKEEFDLWTTFDNRHSKNPNASFPLEIPSLLRKKSISALSSVWAWKYGAFNPRNYSRVISSHHFMAHQAATRDIPHHSYVHTPARYVWRPADDPRLANPLLSPIRSYLKKLDKQAAKIVASYACNSEFTRQQIQTCWGRDSKVIYPFIQNDFFEFELSNNKLPLNEYVLFVGRAAKSFAIRRCLEIAKASNLELVLAISGEVDSLTNEFIEKYKSSGLQIRILQNVNLGDLLVLYKGAIALIHPNIEDFGMSIIESIAVGTPVVVPNRGGSTESVSHGKNGFLVDIEDTTAWVTAVDACSRLERSLLRATVHQFNRRRFMNEINEWLYGA